MKMIILSCVILICIPVIVWSHARLMSPPSRSSMWRFGFPTPINFNDNQLYCGGLTIQWQKNGGKCGICGDPYNMPHPRQNEAGGKYGLGIISKRYVTGQVIDVTVDVTTNHRGYFEFKLCPNNNPKKEVTQECLDKHVLKEAHGSGIHYYIADKRKGEITLQLQLPKGLSCSQCVFQWTYVAGNNWGKCSDGNSGLGCGPQETFRGCADIAIHNERDFFDVKPNEIDLENKQHEIPDHKNNEHNKAINNSKIINYSYEVTKQSRLNSSKPASIRNHNHSHHDTHKNTHLEGDSFSSRTGDKLLTLTKNSSCNHRPYVSSNRRKYKYRNRNLYNFKSNNPLSTKNPFDHNWDILMSNNRWAQSFDKMNVKKERDQIRNKLDTQKSRYTNREVRFKELNLPLMVLSDRDTSVLEGFNLGGERYTDFRLL